MHADAASLPCCVDSTDTRTSLLGSVSVSSSASFPWREGEESRRARDGNPCIERYAAVERSRRGSVCLESPCEEDKAMRPSPRFSYSFADEQGNQKTRETPRECSRLLSLGLGCTFSSSSSSCVSWWEDRSPPRFLFPLTSWGGLQLYRARSLAAHTHTGTSSALSSPGASRFLFLLFVFDFLFSPPRFRCMRTSGRAVVGEVDVEVDESIQLSSVRAAPLKPVRKASPAFFFFLLRLSSRSSPSSVHGRENLRARRRKREGERRKRSWVLAVSLSLSRTVCGVLLLNRSLLDQQRERPRKRQELRESFT